MPNKVHPCLEKCYVFNQFLSWSYLGIKVNMKPCRLIGASLVGEGRGCKKMSRACYHGVFGAYQNKNQNKKS